MEYIRFGRTGLQVSRLCLGCMTYGKPTERWPWALDETHSRPFFQKAFDMGINFFDTADVYTAGASEEVTGKLLKELAPRDSVVIATKVFSKVGPGPNDQGLSRKHIMASIDGSLKRLGTDYVDLYQIHRWDSNTPIEETMEALHDVVRAGKARYIGASSMYAWQFAKALFTADLHGWTRFASMQPYYNLVYREEEREMLPLCKDQGIAVIPWSPLARGLLTGNRRLGGNETERAKTDAYSRAIYKRDDDFEIASIVGSVAAARGVPPAQVALAWVLSKAVVTAPIIGASKNGHLEDAEAALSVKLTEEEVKRMEEAYKPQGVVGHS